MTRLLSIDTSSSSASLAVVEDNVVLVEESYASTRSHNSRLFQPLGEILDSYEHFDGLVVGIGPGSYTGIRIGISAALALSMSREIPLLPICSLHSLIEDEPVAVIGDARRGDYFHGSLDPAFAGFTPTVGNLEETKEAIRRYEEKGAQLLPLDEVALPLVRGGQLPPSVSAGRLAQSVSSLTTEEYARALGTSPRPIYLAAPFTTTPKNKTPGAPRE